MKKHNPVKIRINPYTPEPLNRHPKKIMNVRKSPIIGSIGFIRLEIVGASVDWNSVGNILARRTARFAGR